MSLCRLQLHEAISASEERRLTSHRYGPCTIQVVCFFNLAGIGVIVIDKILACLPSTDVHRLLHHPGTHGHFSLLCPSLRPVPICDYDDKFGFIVGFKSGVFP